FRISFEARIMALSEAHNLLTDSNWEGASLGAILQRVMIAYSGSERARYALGGEDVRVDPRTSVSLVMAFHELATNAAKYGALSNATGQVGIDWTIVGEAPPKVLHIKWRETGGPPVKPPTRRGFGSRLID